MVSSWCYFILPVVLLIGLLRKCRERTWGRCRSTSNLQDRVFLVTGANSGIGKETAKELAKRRATVIMACRDVQSAKNAITEIRSKISTGELVVFSKIELIILTYQFKKLHIHMSEKFVVDFQLIRRSFCITWYGIWYGYLFLQIPMELNLASFSSIREFANEVLKKFPQIHVLINNAGVYAPLKDHALTNDGFEIHFGVNHLGHFLLTNLLLDRLKENAPSRSVIIWQYFRDKTMLS